MRSDRARLLSAAFAALALLLAGCTATVSDDEAPSDTISDEDIDRALAALGFDSRDDAGVPELDVDTLTADTPGRTFEAQAYDNTLVGEVTDELFIGISLDSFDAPTEVTVYVCDSVGVATLLTGEVAADGTVTLASETVSVELTVAGDAATGSVTLAGEGAHAFSASRATGNAGLYEVTDAVEGDDLWARWIVLEDGRQQGMVCLGTNILRVCIGRDSFSYTVPSL